ncbi:hypothetical protein B0I32_115277 [Nonomuraea fuscirosea]|uniref:HNH endonuclease n=1 Tax=Nonomuraea fuscirosea TaxID=1291556 RepID=A0A2T0MSJ6_9ACTN|nr:hypothetical protein B0I32_115277 [Nonomuraea fuscirosea]
MGRQRSYSDSTLAALYALAQGTCYWPDPPCDQPIVKMIDGIPELNVEKAHIYAANPGGPREHENLTSEELDDFPNIILLCRPHHRRIDGRRRDLYPPQVLHEWKRRREGSGLMVLEGLGRITEERLRDIFIEANEVLAGRMKLAMDEFAAFDAEAAALLRTLIDELAAARLNAVGLDPDLITMLSSSSARLMSLADYAPMLAQASLALQHLPDVLPGLVDAATKLHSSADLVDVLCAVVDDLPDDDTVAALVKAASFLQRLPDTVAHLQDVVNELRWAQGNM